MNLTWASAHQTTHATPCHTITYLTTWHNVQNATCAKWIWKSYGEHIKGGQRARLHTYKVFPSADRNALLSSTMLGWSTRRMVSTCRMHIGRECGGIAQGVAPIKHPQRAQPEHDWSPRGAGAHR